MKSSLVFFLLLTMPRFAPAAPWSVDAWERIPILSEPRISPNGKAFAYVLDSVEGNAWRNSIYVNTIPAGDTARVAYGIHPSWSPDSARLAYVDGQVHLYDPGRHTTRTVTHAPSPVTFFRWMPHGEAVVYLSADPGPPPDPIVADSDYRYSRLYLQPLSGGKPRLITSANREVTSFDLSPDGTRVVYAAQATPAHPDALDVDLYEINLATGVEKAVVVQLGLDEYPAYSPDGRWIVFHSQGGTVNWFGERYVGLVPSGGGKIRYLRPAKDNAYDMFRGGTAFTWSPTGKIYYTAAHGTHNFIIGQDVETGTIEALADGVDADVSEDAPSFTPDLSRGVFLQASESRPAEVTLLEGKRQTRLTHIHDDLGAYPNLHLQVVSWKSYDGLAVEGVLALPFGYHGGAVPLLVELHGGPTDIVRDIFPNRDRIYPCPVFLQRGYAIFSPNFRGSANYGADFRRKNADSQGYGDFDDVMSGVDYLIQRGIADPRRLGVVGSSYGGYLGAWVIGHTDRFRVASLGPATTDWFSYYGESEAPRSVFTSYFGALPWDHPELYARHSPRSGMARVRTPTLLTVGTEDISQNREIYWALRDHHVPVEFALYPREPHSFREPVHQCDLMERNLRWVDRWLK